MDAYKVSTVTLAVLFSLGCSPATTPDRPPEAPPPVKTVFDPLTHQLDRARDVQKTVDSNTDGTRKAVDAEERGDNP